MDKDFGELVYNGKQVHSGVLLLRLEEATGVEKTLIMQSIIEKHAHDLSGNFSVFQNGKLRIKK